MNAMNVEFDCDMIRIHEVDGNYNKYLDSLEKSIKNVVRMNIVGDDVTGPKCANDMITDIIMNMDINIENMSIPERNYLMTQIEKCKKYDIILVNIDDASQYLNACLDEIKFRSVLRFEDTNEGENYYSREELFATYSTEEEKKEYVLINDTLYYLFIHELEVLDRLFQIVAQNKDDEKFKNNYAVPPIRIGWLTNHLDYISSYMYEHHCDVVTGVVFGLISEIKKNMGLI